MQVRLWGVRGSVATPMTSEQLRDKMRVVLRDVRPEHLANEAAIDAYLAEHPHGRTYGGNTSCVEVAFGDCVVVLDAGTGIRSLGALLMQDGRAESCDLHICLTHFHWDHICGFPYFGPIYMPDKDIHIWSGRSDAEELLAVQMGGAHFPVKWDRLPSRICCGRLEEGGVHAIAEAELRILPLIHPDKAYGYRIDHEGRAVCYLTDTEVSQNPHRIAERYARFVDGADVVIVDAMYGFLDYHDHINFGHSTIYNFIDFFKDVDIGELVIFHHDPAADDFAVDKLLRSAIRYREVVVPQANWRVRAAREGQVWEL